MRQFLEIVLALPTAVFTAMLLFSLGYWFIAVMFGLDDAAIDGVDIDLDTGIDIEGGADIDVELDGGDVDSGGSDGTGGLAGLLKFFDLHLMPLTIVFTVVSLASWFASAMAVLVLSGGDQPGFVVSLGLGVASFAFGVFVAGRVGRLIGPLFVPSIPVRHRDLVGRVCIVRTGRVDANFGQAEVVDAEKSTHFIQIRCDATNQLTTGKPALIVDVDSEGRFVVSPDVESVL